MAKLPPFIIDSRILSPFRRSTGGTLKAAEKALVCGIGINIGGGYSKNAWHAQYESIKNILSNSH